MNERAVVMALVYRIDEGGNGSRSRKFREDQMHSRYSCQSQITINNFAHRQYGTLRSVLTNILRKRYILKPSSPRFDSRLYRLQRRTTALVDAVVLTYLTLVVCSEAAEPRLKSRRKTMFVAVDEKLVFLARDGVDATPWLWVPDPIPLELAATTRPFWV